MWSVEYTAVAEGEISQCANEYRSIFENELHLIRTQRL
jgi:hypothetical protein